MRATVVDVRIAFKNYAEVLTGMGVDTSKLSLQEASGSQTYRALMDGWGAPGTSNAAFANGYLGATAREAVHTLRTAIRALEFAHTHLSN